MDPTTLIFHSMHFYNSATQNDMSLILYTKKIDTSLILYTLIKCKKKRLTQKSSPQEINIPCKLYQKRVNAKLENTEILELSLSFPTFSQQPNTAKSKQSK